MTPTSVLCLVNMAVLLIIAFIGFPYLLSEKDSIDYVKIAGGCYRALLATIAVTLGAYYYFDNFTIFQVWKNVRIYSAFNNLIHYSL